MNTVKLSAAEKIGVLLIRRGLNKSKLAKQLNTSGANLSNKLNRDNFRISELQEIANLLGCDLEIFFVDRETGERW